jgi:uncharacterized damage-inducible protein DinB
MTPATILADAFGRILESGLAVLDGLDDTLVAQRPAADANTIGWLLWHLTRIQDDHVAGVAGQEQVWTAQGFAERFGLPFGDADTGYGHSGEDVAAVRAEPDLLADYLRATHERTLDYLARADEAELERVVDERWDPPVTAAVRLVSVVADDLQHVGQAAYVRGLLDR